MSKEDAISVLPSKNTEKFIRDVKQLFSLDEDQILMLVHELQSKGDSFSHRQAAKIAGIRINRIPRQVAIIVYVNHLVRSHGIATEEFTKAFISMGCDKQKVSSFVTKIANLDEDAKARIDSFYWITSSVLHITHVERIRSKLVYSEIRGEDDEIFGLAPIINVTFITESEHEEKEEYLDSQFTLDGLGTLIGMLQEAHDKATMDARKLKEELKTKILCIPSDN
ncbi:MAG: hypothetical protein ACREBU_08310 [Nitrososphaera sp.]